ncbi:MAG: hypothetical protein LBI96_05135 [Odoribacteraceae bacterium]|jgi:hypothetical protein|nr:hypothetical protein [Odoribacteraceae bacterium]
MLIANPIYDVVFKYMMEDKKVARLLISAIIGEKVLDLEFLPQENISEGEGKIEMLTVYHIDFSANVETPEGHKSVIIEMQKAKNVTDIMRFRRYLGGRYQDQRNVHVDATNVSHARQIYCIFFLGYDIGISDASLLEVDSRVRDRMTGKEFTANGEFIEGLHHRSWIIQISRLKSRRRDDLERLLAIFDQENTDENRHYLFLPEEGIPKEYNPILRRLQRAIGTPQMRAEMTREDFDIEERRITERTHAMAIEEKDKVIEEQAKALVEREQALEEQAKAIEEQAKAIENLAREIEALKRTPGKA